MDVLQKLPPKKDRTENTFYIDKEERKVYWNGNKVLCPHKIQWKRCNTCQEEIEKKKKEKRRNLPKDIPEAPNNVKDREDNTKYIYDGEIRIWKRGRFLCFHECDLSKCKKSHDMEEYERYEKEKNQSEEEEDMSKYEEAPKKVSDRVIGKKYILRDQIRIWSGKRFNCKCNLINCKKCKKREKTRIILLPKKPKNLVEGQFYLYKKCVCVWKNEWYCGEHNLKYSDCEECKKENIQTLPKLQNDRTDNTKYIYDGRLCYWRNNELQCEHFGRYSRCIKCQGGSICQIHLKLRSRCECGGSELCECGKRKEFCLIHEGTAMCEKHGMRKERCTGDGCKKGSGVCEKHERRQEACKDCEGAQICPNSKLQKQKCRCCKGSRICKNCEYTIASTYFPYCAPCFYEINDIDPPNRYRHKEWYINDFLKENIEDIEFTHNKKIDGGSSKRRPDWFYDCKTHSIIIECDENGHNAYDNICENKRICEIFGDLANRPIVVIRFNPDKNKEDPGCFYYSSPSSSVLRVQEEEWEKRSKILLERIQFHIENVQEKEIHIEKLFY